MNMLGTGCGANVVLVLNAPSHYGHNNNDILAVSVFFSAIMYVVPALVQRRGS